jgi:hypothetical protein
VPNRPYIVDLKFQAHFGAGNYICLTSGKKKFGHFLGLTLGNFHFLLKKGIYLIVERSSKPYMSISGRVKFVNFTSISKFEQFHLI